MRPHYASRRSIHPTLRMAAGEMARLCALLALYAVLLGLFALAALGVWVQLPSAMVDSRLIPDSATTTPGEPVKLRGSL